MFYVHRVPGSNPGGTIFIFMVILNRTDKRRKINKIKQEKKKEKRKNKEKRNEAMSQFFLSFMFIGEMYIQ